MQIPGHTKGFTTAVVTQIPSHTEGFATAV
jgi:hypothetical protein